MLLTRGVEGFITTDTSITEKIALPTVAVAGHQLVDGVTNIILDHTRAARLALEHLRDLGHEEIAFIRGQTMSSDSTVRWNAICEVAQELGIRIRPELTIQLEGFDSTPGIGYTFCKQLLARKHPFTALFAYNDIAAIGSIWAIREAGLRVPEDISIVGFDDISGAAYANPGLTTVRQPLMKMAKSRRKRSSISSKGAANTCRKSPSSRNLWFASPQGPPPCASFEALKRPRHICKRDI